MPFESLIVGGIVLSAVIYLIARLRTKRTSACSSGSCCGGKKTPSSRA